MRNYIDSSSWQGVISTLVGLVLVSLVAVGVRLLIMHGVQQRRERQNRQINERLKTLIAAYKTLGGSFTGNLAVDPSHLRELRMRQDTHAARANDAAASEEAVSEAEMASRSGAAGADRRRRIRDAVEAALSDIILLGTEQQVRLAARAANDMVAGRAVETAELVVSLRNFIRDVLDLDPIPVQVEIPKQGPVRVSGTSTRGARPERGAGAGGGGAGGARAGAEGMGAHRETALDPGSGPDRPAGG